MYEPRWQNLIFLRVCLRAMDNWRPEIDGDCISRLHLVRHWQLVGCFLWSARPRIRFAIDYIISRSPCPSNIKVIFIGTVTECYLFIQRNEDVPLFGHRSQWRSVVCLKHEHVTLFYFTLRHLRLHIWSLSTKAWFTRNLLILNYFRFYNGMLAYYRVLFVPFVLTLFL